MDKNTQAVPSLELHTEPGRERVFIDALAAAVGGLLFGYDTSVISGAILFVRDYFRLDSFRTELAVSIVLAGAFLGASFAGYLGDRLGRKPVQMANALVFAIFAVATGVAGTLSVFLFGRFMVGIAVGVTSMITPLYIAEISPPKIRGALVQLNQLMIGVGVAVAYLVAWLLSGSGNWRWMFISAVLPSIVLLIALFFLPESPRWLATRGRIPEARSILCRLYGKAGAEKSLAELLQVIEANRLRLRDVFGRRFRKPLIAGVGLAIFQQITGINTIVYYTPIIMQMAGFKSASSAILMTLLIGSLNVLFAMSAVVLLDRVGRRPLLLMSIAGMTLALLHLGWEFGVAHPSRVAVLVDFLLYLASFAIGLGPVFWLLISEIYPVAIRGQAMSLASMTIWASDLVITLTFLTLVDLLGARGLFWIYAGACLAAFAFAARTIPETRGRTLEEIEAHW